MEFAMKIPDELRKKYTERRARDADELAKALDSGELSAFGRIGHQLKGNAATFGYESLAILGRKMEEVAANQSNSEGQECLTALQTWIREQLAKADSEGTAAK